MKHTILCFFLFLSITLFAQNEKWREKYDKVFPFSKNNHHWMYVQKGHFYGAVNQNGKELVPIIFTDIIENDFGGVMVFQKDGKWGTYTPQGNTAAPFLYQNIVFGADRYGIFQRNDKWGYMDSDGEEMIPPQYTVAHLMANDRAAVQMGEKWAIINREGRFKTNFIYDEVEDFEHFQSKVLYKGNYGLVDTAGKWLLSPMYQNIFRHVGLFHAQKNDKWGFIDINDKVIIPFEYENNDIGSLWIKDGLICAKKNGKWGCFNHLGEVVVPFEYDNVASFYTKLGPLYKNGKWGFVDNTGKIVVPFIYDDLFSACWGEEWVGVKRDGKWTLISEDGKEMMPPTYDFLECFVDDDPIRVQLNGKWGYINKKAEVVIPCIYDEAANFPNYQNLFELKKEGKTLFFDKKGKEVK